MSLSRPAAKRSTIAPTCSALAGSYFMCTGHPPFRADSTPAVLKRVCEDRPRALREVNPDIPDWLAAVVERLLAKEAGGRFSTAAEVAEVLKHHLADLQRTGTSSPLSTNPSPVVPKSSRRLVVAAIALTSAVVVASVGRSGIYKPYLGLMGFGGNGAPIAVGNNDAGNGGRPRVLAAPVHSRSPDHLVGRFATKARKSPISAPCRWLDVRAEM